MDLPDRGLIAAYGRDVVASRPKVLPREVLPPPEVGARDVDGALPLDESQQLCLKASATVTYTPGLREVKNPLPRRRKPGINSP